MCCIFSPLGSKYLNIANWWVALTVITVIHINLSICVHVIRSGTGGRWFC